MDSIDRGIVFDLRRNCRTTYTTLSDKYGISPNAIKKRIERLRAKGIIERYVVQLSLAMADLEHLFVLIYTDKSVDDETLADLVFSHQSVKSVQYDSTGTCVTQAEFSGIDELNDLSRFFRGLESVRDVELHPLPLESGQKVSLSNLQLRVLGAMVDDPRKPISEIARSAGLTTRRVRRILGNLVNCGGIQFTIQFDLSNADSVYIAFRLGWNERDVTPAEIGRILQEEFPNEFIKSSISATEPLMWCDFLVGHTSDLETISVHLRKIPSVVIESTILIYPPKRRRNLREQRLRNLIADAGL